MKPWRPRKVYVYTCAAQHFGFVPTLAPIRHPGLKCESCGRPLAPVPYVRPQRKGATRAKAR